MAKNKLKIKWCSGVEEGNPYLAFKMDSAKLEIGMLLTAIITDKSW